MLHWPTRGRAVHSGDSALDIAHQNISGPVLWCSLGGIAKSSAPICFEAALPPTGHAFTLDSEGEATLRLVVSEQFAKVLSDSIHRLRNCSFIVKIEGLGKLPGE